MSKFDHPHLIKTLQTCTSGHKLYIIMPLMDIGSLNSVINIKYPSGIKDMYVLATILKICLETLDYLHSKSYLHRDIKSSNILIDSNGFVTLGDFGVSTKIKNESKKKSFVGTLNWMPPEVISKEGYDYKVIFKLLKQFDIWSLGITAIEISQGKPPFYGYKEIDIIKKVQNEDPPTLKDPSKFDILFVNLIKSCLVKDPSKRPSAKEVLEINSEFFIKYTKDSQYLKTNLLKSISSIKDRVRFEFNIKNNKYNNIHENDPMNSNNENQVINEKVNWDFSRIADYNNNKNKSLSKNNNKLDTYSSDLNPVFRFSDSESKLGNVAILKKMSSIVSFSSSNDNLSMYTSEENGKLKIDMSRKECKSLTTINPNKVLNPEINDCLNSKSQNFKNKFKNEEENGKLNNKEKLKKLFICDDEA